ncbi:MAG: DUF4260 family protein [Mangrovibacterium sp.]
MPLKWSVTSFPAPQAMLTGIVLFGHSSMDSAFGFGLKYADDFKYTHLGKTGERQE